MDIVVIVLLVLIGVIVLTKGKPLWSWMKENQGAIDRVLLTLIRGTILGIISYGVVMIFGTPMLIVVIPIWIMLVFYPGWVIGTEGRPPMGLK